MGKVNCSLQRFWHLSYEADYSYKHSVSTLKGRPNLIDRNNSSNKECERKRFYRLLNDIFTAEMDEDVAEIDELPVLDVRVLDEMKKKQISC